MSIGKDLKHWALVWPFIYKANCLNKGGWLNNIFEYMKVPFIYIQFPGGNCDTYEIKARPCPSDQSSYLSPRTRVTKGNVIIICLNCNPGLKFQSLLITRAFGFSELLGKLKTYSTLKMIKVVAQPGGSPQGVFLSNLLGAQTLWAQ